MSNGDSKNGMSSNPFERQIRVNKGVGPSTDEPVKSPQKSLLLFDNRRIRHLERMIDLFHTLFQNNK